MDLAVKGEHLDELVRLVYNRLTGLQSVETATEFAKQLLRQYLAAEKEDARVTALLEIRDLLKPATTKTVR